jgi:hypothetical protein
MKMKRHHRITALLACFVSCNVTLLAASGAAAPETRTAIVGTWRLVSYNYQEKGDLMPVPAEMVRIKHITPGHFQWVAYDAKTKKVVATAGGRWTMDGSKYTETVEYGSGDDYEVVKDQDHSFTMTVEGDRLHQKGKLASGLTIDELYDRMK